jgi:hypothetical protein
MSGISILSPELRMPRGPGYLVRYTIERVGGIGPITLG